MTVRSAMVHRCQIERNANEGLRDEYNNELAPDWFTLEDEQPCYFYQSASQQTGEYRGDEQLHTVVLATHEVLVPPDADVTPQDRVYEIVNRRGQVVASGRYNITQVLLRPNHKLLVLESVR